MLLGLLTLVIVSFSPVTAWEGNGANWTISNDVITHVPGGGDFISSEVFESFELSFDWKIAPDGNSGVFYRVNPDMGPAYESGPEYQIVDNKGHSDGNNPLTSAGSAFGLYAPARDLTRPAGAWNSGKIVVVGMHVEHWLNGEKILEFTMGSEDWLRRVAASKFRAWPEFGTQARGHIVLQDHGAEVMFRNVLVRVLP